MLTLYVKTGCPYSAKAISAAEELGLEVTYKNKDDTGVMEELIAVGGEDRFPFLVDDARGVKMYESDDIVAYLNEHYGT